MQIYRSDRFTKEYDSVVRYISECSDDQTKKELNRLLTELVQNVKKMDQLHQDLHLVNRLADNSNEIRNKIIETRKKIFRIIDRK